MAFQFRPLHPRFVAEVGRIDLRQVHDAATLAEIRAGMDRYAVLVFRDQPFTDDEQIAFAERLDGQLHMKTGAAALGLNRLGHDALADISNLDEQGDIAKPDDRRRAYGLGNRLWHTDASFQDPPGRYSMLSAKVIPPAGADTEYADMRAAYDALPAETKARLEGLRVHHSIAHSRQTLGFEFSPEEEERLKGAVLPSTGRSRRAGCSSGTSSSTRPSRSSSTGTPGGWAISSSGTTAPRCTARGPSTTSRIAASSGA
jgi:alpha-ketoglutarate-dependent 2,4-dichlorophenoxyacetate dioxygenase